jgi:hypothetical protein
MALADNIFITGFLPDAFMMLNGQTIVLAGCQSLLTDVLLQR